MKIQVIIGSTREERFGDKPAHWIFQETKKKEGLEAELLDLRDYPLPFFNDPVSPSKANGQYANSAVQNWANKIKMGDGYIIVTPEYNHGYPAVLKNALDSIFIEWAKKPVGFVAYGGAGGARSVEQLRQVAVELEMAPIRKAIHIPGQVYLAVKNQTESDKSDPYETLKPQVDAFFEQLIWWTKALKEAREK